MRRGQLPGLASSPVLVGAVTVLVTVVAVFLAYNANAGLPFVPTYDLEANVPNAANLVRGNEVRIGGARVGTVTTIKAKARPNGKPYARLSLKLDRDVKPLPKDTTFLVRPRSALGLKYLDLVPGRSKQGYAAGDTIPEHQGKPLPVELDEVFNMFNNPTRIGARGALQGFGNGLAGRGEDLNSAITELRPLLDDLEPVARNLASPSTQLGRFVRALGATAAELAPVGGQQAELFAALDTTFGALANVARPFIQDTIAESPETERVATTEFPRQRPFIRNSTAFFRELRPGVATLPHAAPLLADALAFGRRTLPKTPALNRRLTSAFDALATFSEEPGVTRGVAQLTHLARSLRPTLSFLTPAQTTCNYVTLLFRNAGSLLSQGDGNGTWQRFIIIATPVGPNSEGTASSRPANGGGPTPADNHLHANPYPNTAAPGQPNECESGNEPYEVGRTVIGNVAGNQGRSTDAQKKAGK